MDNKAMDKRLYAEKRLLQAILGRDLEPEEWGQLQELVRKEAQEGRPVDGRQGEVKT